MQFLKKHYEKIILSLVLLGLAAAAALMVVKVSQEGEKEAQRLQDEQKGKAKKFPPIDLTTNKVTLERLSKPRPVVLAGEHNLFNPVPWEKTPDGTIRKKRTGSEGVGALVVTSIVPLNLIVTFDDVTGTNDNVKYLISVLRETDKAPHKTTRQAIKGSKNNMFTVLDVKGETNAPSAIVLSLEGDKEPISVSREKPYTKVVGYAADVRYDPDLMVRKGLKAKDVITFGGEIYNIVAITPTEVVVSAKSNSKQTAIKFNRQ